MKKTISVLALVAMVTASQAQSDKYLKAMEERVNAMDTVKTQSGWQSLANSFERIGDAEKNQWLPYYYAALSNVMTGYMMMNSPAGASNSTQLDLLGDKAEVLLGKAEAIESENSEIFCVKKMVATLKMSADPMNRYQTYGPRAAEALARAKALDAGNPRVYLLEGQDKFFTPEQFGGSKVAAKQLFEEALAKYDSHKPKSSIHPRWGLNQVKYFHSQIK